MQIQYVQLGSPDQRKNEAKGGWSRGTKKARSQNGKERTSSGQREERQNLKVELGREARAVQVAERFARTSVNAYP